MAPQVGFEPTTLRLTAECSTIELLRSVVDRSPLQQTYLCQVNFSFHRTPYFRISQISLTCVPRPLPPSPGFRSQRNVSLPSAVAALGTSKSTGRTGLSLARKPCTSYFSSAVSRSSTPKPSPPYVTRILYSADGSRFS